VAHAHRALDPYLFGPDQQCFGCGPNNQHGMQLRFRVEGEEVVTTFEARPGWEGAPGIVHGGLQATLADELGAWTLVGLKHQFGFTTKLDLRYYRPARADQPIEGRGSILKDSEQLTTVKVTLRQDGKRVLSGRITYSRPTIAMAEKILNMPLPESWRHLTRPEPESGVETD
jgi:uncharacterized protein (TIGR00369 family)